MPAPTNLDWFMISMEALAATCQGPCIKLPEPVIEPATEQVCTEHRRGVLMTCEEAKLFDAEAFRKYQAAKQHEKDEDAKRRSYQ